MGIVHRPATPAAEALPADSRLKMHLRLLTVGGYTYRLVTLRPITKVAFSTNFFHQTWHIVTDQVGSQLLARLLWGLSFERHPGTLLLVHGDHLLPTPFEAERSDPFLFAPANLTSLDAAGLRLLKSRLNRLGPPAKTIRWQTFGLDAALRARRDHSDDGSPLGEESAALSWKKNHPLWQQERMRRLGGFLCYSAPPAILRQQALRIHDLRVQQGNDARGMDYHYLAEKSSRDSWCDGEVQIFSDYLDRVAAATEARQELVANPKAPVLSETVQEAISRRRDQIKARRKSNHDREAVRRKLALARR
jgi:hypothetical protein